MRLAAADVDRYGPLTGCHPPCGEGVTIVAGPNEAGKTLYLEALLQLLDPDVTASMDPPPRVAGTPAGRVVVEDGDDRHVLGEGTALSDVSRIDPAHLATLFVIRDADLALPEGTDYYASLVDHLGDIHTTAIAAMREELLDEGLLTPSRLSLRDREHDTKAVRADAASLADDVASYLEEVEAASLDRSVRERLRTRRELSRVRERLETQRTARELAAQADAREQLRRYRGATTALADLAAFDGETLEELRDHEHGLAHLEERIDELEADLAATRAAADERREALREARDRGADLARREGDVERVDEALEAYREAASATTGESVAASLALRRRVAIAALGGGGLAVAGGTVAGSPAALAIGLLLLAVAGGAWYAHRRLVGRLADREAREDALLRAARDAGFEVERPDDVAPRLREYRDDVEGTSSRIDRLEVELEGFEDRIGSLGDELAAKREEREELAGKRDDRLEAAGVDSVASFEERVEERADRRRRRDAAAQLLERELGVPDADDPDARIAHWESVLEARAAALGEPDVDADAYDEEELDALEAEREELAARLEELEAELEAFHDRLEEFERRAGELTPPPVAEADPALEAWTVEGLEDLAASLRELVSEIEDNADLSRKAIGVLEEIRVDEERKVTRLFDPEGPASRYLSRLTDGRYEAVDYDPEETRLAVTAADGQSLGPHRLSRATADQLYFAARLSLVDQLLDGESGFLLLDDPFLAADPDRLRHGFEILADLADDGWQVLYLTAKPEVHDEMATAFDCEVYELDRLER